MRYLSKEESEKIMVKRLADFVMHRVTEDEFKKQLAIDLEQIGKSDKFDWAVNEVKQIKSRYWEQKDKLKKSA